MVHEPKCRFRSRIVLAFFVFVNLIWKCLRRGEKIFDFSAVCVCIKLKEQEKVENSI